MLHNGNRPGHRVPRSHHPTRPTSWVGLFQCSRDQLPTLTFGIAVSFKISFSLALDRKEIVRNNLLRVASVLFLSLCLSFFTNRGHVHEARLFRVSFCDGGVFAKRIAFVRRHERSLFSMLTRETHKHSFPTQDGYQHVLADARSCSRAFSCGSTLTRRARLHGRARAETCGRRRPIRRQRR